MITAGRRLRARQRAAVGTAVRQGMWARRVAMTMLWSWTTRSWDEGQRWAARLACRAEARYEGWEAVGMLRVAAL